MFKLSLIVMLVTQPADGPPVKQVAAIIVGLKSYKTEVECLKADVAAIPLFRVIFSGNRTLTVGDEFTIKPSCVKSDK